MIQIFSMIDIIWHVECTQYEYYSLWDNIIYKLKMCLQNLSEIVITIREDAWKKKEEIYL